MKVGMLWYDNSQCDLDAKIQKAAAYYQNKYRKTAVMCFVNPASVPDGTTVLMLGAIEVRSSHNIPKNHFWIGGKEQA